MLSSLEIRNFKNLDYFRINALGMVNLFTGKNNTGKSSILEALAIYASKGDLSTIYQLLDDRGESYKSINNTKGATESNVRALSSLFPNRQINYSLDSAITVSAVVNTLLGKQMSNEKFVSIRLVKYYDETISDIDNDLESFRTKRIILNESGSDVVADYNIGIEIKTSSNSLVYRLNRDRPYRVFPGNTVEQDNTQFVRTRNIDREVNGKLWDNITLSEKERYVTDALNIIEPDVDRIAFIEETAKERTAVVKLKSSNTVFPLKSMGDGINRILTIILALVNADNGFLLIDEFENGLHYTAQEKLWKIIFSLSKKLNVQVYATTHSQDCILGFERVLNNTANISTGKLIRLDAINQKIRQVEFSPSELKIAAEQEIETR